MSRSLSWGSGVLLVGAVALGVGAIAGCRDDDDVVHAGGGNASVTGTAGRAAGGAGGGAMPGGGGTGAAGAAGAAGKLSCDCGSDVNEATIPLDCACAAGLCPTFQQDLATYRSGLYFSLPYYVLLGTCASGYRTLSFEEATEQGGRRTYDSSGRMVHDYLGGYNGVVPDACGFKEHFSFGSVTIGGEDPATSCTYCLVDGNDQPSSDAEGGAAGTSAGAPYYPESKTQPCDPALFE